MRLKALRGTGVALTIGALMLATAGTVSAQHGRGGSLGAMISTPRTLNFGSVAVGGFACQTVWIKNATTAYVVWTGTSDSVFVGRNADAFNYCPVFDDHHCLNYGLETGLKQLAPGDSCWVDVSFAPLESGAHTATLQLPWTDGYGNHFDSSTGLKGTAFWP
jgi:hypothetical protein